MARIDDPESREEMNSEQKIQEGLINLFQSINKLDEPGLIFFESAENGVWRLKSFYNAVLSMNRALVLNASQYILLEKLIQIGYIQDIDLSKINVYLPCKDTCLFDPKA